MHLTTKFPNAGIIIAGDKNKLATTPIINSLPHVKQIVGVPTHNSSILDIIITNLHKFFATPVAMDPVEPNDATTHKKYDHRFVVAIPIAHSVIKATKTYTIKKVRPTLEHARKEFGR